MTIQQDLVKPALPAFVELFTLDMTNIGGTILYFTPNTIGGNAAVTFGTQVYTPMPITGSGWERSVDGAPPRPTLKVSNITRFIQPYLSTFNDIVGARLTRVLTLDKYLASGSSPDSTQVFGSNTYIIQQKSKQNKMEVEFVLGSIIDAPNFRLPKGQVLRSEFPAAGLFRKN